MVKLMTHEKHEKKNLFERIYHHSLDWKKMVTCWILIFGLIGEVTVSRGFLECVKYVRWCENVEVERRNERILWWIETRRIIIN